MVKNNKTKQGNTANYRATGLGLCIKLGLSFFFPFPPSSPSPPHSDVILTERVLGQNNKWDREEVVLQV